MTVTPKINKILWMRKHWNIKNNPFPSDAIARLGGLDPRENGLLFDPGVLPERVQEAKEKFVLGVAFGGIKFGFLWSLGAGKGALGFGKSSLMQYLVEQVNEDFGKQIILENGLGETDAEEHPICAVLASFDMANARSLNAVLYEAARYACRFRRDPEHPTLAERIQQRLISIVGSSKPKDLVETVMNVQLNLRGRTLGPPIKEFLELLCGEDAEALEKYVDAVTPGRRTRNGANYLATFLIFVKVSQINHVLLCCDQLEDFAASTTSKQKRTLETERFRDYLLEIQPMSDMLGCIVTMHPRAEMSIKEMWAMADLPSYDYSREENMHRVVILDGVQTDEQAQRLIWDYLKPARTKERENKLYPFTPDAVEAILVRSDKKPRDILRKAHALIERGAEKNWDIIDGSKATEVLANFAAESDEDFVPPGAAMPSRGSLWK